MITEKAEFVNILCDFFQPMIISYNNTNLCYDTNLSLHFLQLLDSHEDWAVIDRMTAIQKDSHWKPVNL